MGQGRRRIYSRVGQGWLCYDPDNDRGNARAGRELRAGACEGLASCKGTWLSVARAYPAPVPGFPRHPLPVVLGERQFKTIVGRIEDQPPPDSSCGKAWLDICAVAFGPDAEVDCVAGCVLAMPGRGNAPRAVDGIDTMMVGAPCLTKYPLLMGERAKARHAAHFCAEMGSFDRSDHPAQIGHQCELHLAFLPDCESGRCLGQ